MKNEKDDFERVENKLRGLFQKKAESLPADKGLWLKIEPRLGEQQIETESKKNRMKFGRWFIGGRLVAASVAMSVFLILVVIISISLISYNSSYPEIVEMDLSQGGTVDIESAAITHMLGLDVPLWQRIFRSNADDARVDAIVGNTNTPAINKPALLPPAVITQTLDITRRDIIYNASISLTVNTISTAMNQVQDLAQSSGGYTDSMSSSGGQDQQQASITIRVPQDQFFPTLAKIQGLGTVHGQNISSQDVTQEFIDLQARLKSAQLQEQSLQSLLDKAQTIGDIISIQEKLTGVRSDIESLQGQINYIQNRVDMSSIVVSLSTVTVNTGEPPSATLVVSVLNVDDSLASVKQLVTGANGIIDKSSIHVSDYRESAYLTLRVYRSDFAQILSAVQKEGKIKEKTVKEATGGDVFSSQQNNTPPDAVIALSLVHPSGLSNGAVVGIASGVVVIALVIFLTLAYRAGALRKRVP